ncbi:hypothetical protein CYMTET_37893 [Cymbomonas tetramitiformis]|uniref:Uncharacterized protein n=1 Tax=Cymbomonas tetramitiformis TaxID=36881 RepID=A0AAE0CEU3_9CHLO|nr:hypothetical protein CYMTET_37893 [Cymbomonas tetramitiformis]
MAPALQTSHSPAAYRLLMSPETVIVKQATEYERNRCIAMVSLTILSPAFLQPMRQKLPAEFQLEFGGPELWAGHFRVFGEDDTNEELEYTPPPFKKSRSASSSPALAPRGLFAASPGAGASAGASAVISAVPVPAAALTTEPDYIVAAAVNLKENVNVSKPKAAGKGKGTVKP